MTYRPKNHSYYNVKNAFRVQQQNISDSHHQFTAIVPTGERSPYFQTSSNSLPSTCSAVEMPPRRNASAKALLEMKKAHEMSLSFEVDSPSKSAPNSPTKDYSPTKNSPLKKVSPANKAISKNNKNAKNKKAAAAVEESTEKDQQPLISDLFKQEKKGSKGKAAKKKEVQIDPKTGEPKKKRTVDRFNGMPEEEIAKKGLPDYLKPGLDIVFIGINPSMWAAYTGKYYDGPGNHFWPALHLSGFCPRPMTPQDDHTLMDLGIGFTNVCARTTRAMADLKKAEIVEGAKILREKLAKYRPKIAVFNGKSIYQTYSGQKKFMFGKQPEPLEGSDGQTWVWVMPSTSALVAQLPRATDKVPFFLALRRFRDYLNGLTDEPPEEEIVFANVVLKTQKKNAVKAEPVDPDEAQQQADLAQQESNLAQQEQQADLSQQEQQINPVQPEQMQTGLARRESSISNLSQNDSGLDSLENSGVDQQEVPVVQQEKGHTYDDIAA